MPFRSLSSLPSNRFRINRRAIPSEHVGHLDWFVQTCHYGCIHLILFCMTIGGYLGLYLMSDGLKWTLSGLFASMIVIVIIFFAWAVRKWRELTQLRGSVYIASGYNDDHVCVIHILLLAYITIDLKL